MSSYAKYWSCSPEFPSQPCLTDFWNFMWFNYLASQSVDMAISQETSPVLIYCPSIQQYAHRESEGRQCTLHTSQSVQTSSFLAQSSWLLKLACGTRDLNEAKRDKKSQSIELSPARERYVKQYERTFGTHGLRKAQPQQYSSIILGSSTLTIIYLQLRAQELASFET